MIEQPRPFDGVKQTVAKMEQARLTVTQEIYRNPQELDVWCRAPIDERPEELEQWLALYDSAVRVAATVQVTKSRPHSHHDRSAHTTAHSARPDRL